MSEQPFPDSESPNTDGAADRRNFLSRSGMMIALMAIAGTGPAEAAATYSASDAGTVKSVLTDAMASGKVDPKSPAFLKLNKSLQDALSGLSASDLATLRSANEILSSRITSTADNNGTVGM